MNVVLIGYRGSGKTSVGRLLAERLGKTFVDSDHETRRRCFDNATIADIWQTHGEPAWRRAEAAVTTRLLTMEDHVIALGGGTPMIPAVREALKSAANCRRVYLRCEPEELYRRISKDADTAGSRPSLTAHGGGLEEIRMVLAQREPVYREVCDVEVDVTRPNPEAVAEDLIQRLR